MCLYSAKMARAGAFSANFNPDTLDAFRRCCQEKGLKYTKVLEHFAELYLATDGEILSEVSVPSTGRPHSVQSDPDVKKRLDRLEESDEYNEETFATLFRRLEAVEQKLKSK